MSSSHRNRVSATEPTEDDADELMWNDRCGEGEPLTFAEPSDTGFGHELNDTTCAARQTWRSKKVAGRYTAAVHGIEFRCDKKKLCHPLIDSLFGREPRPSLL